MAARIQLSEPAADVVDMTTSDAQLSIYDVQINGLIHAGIITHRFKTAESLDMMFAMSELQDLPEIRFVAAFKNGIVYIGCPDEPPPCLFDLIEPVAPLSSDATSVLDAHVTSALERIDDLAQRLEQLDSALQGQGRDDLVRGAALDLSCSTDLHGSLEHLDEKMNIISQSLTGSEVNGQAKAKDEEPMSDEDISDADMAAVEQIEAEQAQTEETEAKAASDCPNKSDIEEETVPEPEVEPVAEPEPDNEPEAEPEPDEVPASNDVLEDPVAQDDVNQASPVGTDDQTTVETSQNEDDVENEGSEQAEIEIARDRKSVV